MNGTTPSYLTYALASDMVNTTVKINNTEVTFFYNPCKEPTKSENIAYVTFLILVIIVSISGNMLVCFAVGMSRKLRSSPTNYFIVSLAVSDLLYSIFITPIRVTQNLHNQKFCVSVSLCRMYIAMDTFCTTASISNLYVIALDRFLAIVKPFQYQELMSKKRAYVIIAAVWHYSALWTGLSTFSWETGQTSININNHQQCTNENKDFYVTCYFVVYIIPLAIMSCTYLTIFRVALAHVRAIRAQEVSFPDQESSMEIDHPSNRRQRKRAKQTRKELKATKTVAVVYGAFVICWLPSCIINVILLFDSMVFPKLFQSDPALFKFIYFTFIEILPILSSLVNPFIYGIANMQFRQAFKVVILRLAGRHDLAVRVVNGDVTSRWSKHAPSIVSN